MGRFAGKLGLFTPLLNEADCIDRLFDTVIRQTLKPIVWLIVDDGSTDESVDKLDLIRKRFTWVEVICRQRGHERTDLAMANVFDFGLRTLASRLLEEPTGECYLAKLDADLLLAPDCLEALVKAMSMDGGIGIIGPSLGEASVNPHGLAYHRASPLHIIDEPTDGIRVYRYSCLSGIGWIPQVPSPDAAALRSAREAGWKTIRLPETLAWTTRRPGSNLSWEARGLRWASTRCSLPLVLANVAGQVLVERSLRGLPAILSYAQEVSGVKANNPKIARTLRGQLHKLRIR